MSIDRYDPANFHQPAIDRPLTRAQMRANRSHFQYQDRRLYGWAAGGVALAGVALLSWMDVAGLTEPLVFWLAALGAGFAIGRMGYFDLKGLGTLNLLPYSLDRPLRGERMCIQLDEWAGSHKPIREYLALVSQQLRPVMVGDYCFLADWMDAAQHRRQYLAAARDSDAPLGASRRKARVR